MNPILISIFGLIVAVLLLALVIELVRKNIHIWLWTYIVRKTEKPAPGEPVHIMFAFCDHYEPGWGRVDYEVEASRVDRWCRDYPVMADRHKDADGRPPQHTFFYPEEEYRQEHLDKLAKLCRDGYGEIEIHLHHDDDTAEGLQEKISGFLKTLEEKHQSTIRHPETGQYQFAFIHGNWALDNSRNDGRWCGVNNELKVLSDLGCYADYTLPSAPSDTQTAKINSIYYATGQDGKSKSHNDGVDVEVGKPEQGDLMIIQGPLALNWQNRKFGIFPRIENSDIRKDSAPSRQRVDLWVKCGIKVKKKPQWLFIKVHTHGTQEKDMDTLLGGPSDEMYDYFETKYNDGKNFVLHYVTAREMYNIIKAAEAGEQGTPDEYRDYILPRHYSAVDK